MRIQLSLPCEALVGNEDLPSGQWSLLHLKGTELQTGLQSLCVARVLTVSSNIWHHGVGTSVPTTATRSMILGSAMMSQAEAAKQHEEDGKDFGAIWIAVCAWLSWAQFPGRGDS